MSIQTTGQWVPTTMRDGKRIKPIKYATNGVNIQLYPKLEGYVEPHIANGTMEDGGGNWSDTPWNDEQKQWISLLGLSTDSMGRNVYVLNPKGKRITKATGELLDYCIKRLETALPILDSLVSK
jgi:hypothetical protein